MTASEVAIVGLCVWIMVCSLIIMWLCMRALLLKRKAKQVLGRMLVPGPYTSPEERRLLSREARRQLQQKPRAMG
jgi:hypothetical protein